MILEGIIAHHDREEYGQVEIKGGIITEVARHIGTPDIKLKKEIIFAGFGDTHIHAREDSTGNKNHKETFKTIDDAAIHGGVTHVADMPNNDDAPIDNASYARKSKLITESIIDIILYAGIGQETYPLDKKVPYKIYMGPDSKEGIYVKALDFYTEKQIDIALARYNGEHVAIHCEDYDMLQLCKNALTHEDKRPNVAETIATKFALEMIKKHNLKGKLCHYSTKEGMKLILAAKEEDLSVTCEVTPHHLYFDKTMLTDENRKWLQMNPPLRGVDDRLALINYLREGDVDFLATDHAPHTIEEKIQGISGVPHLDTVGSFTTWLMKEHDFTTQDIARVAAYNPGRYVNNFTEDKFGEIKEGYVGSFTILDMDTPTKVTRDSIKSKCGWSPFDEIVNGKSVVFPGSVKHTIIRGNVY